MHALKTSFSLLYYLRLLSVTDGFCFQKILVMLVIKQLHIVGIMYVSRLISVKIYLEYEGETAAFSLHSFRR